MYDVTPDVAGIDLATCLEDTYWLRGIGDEIVNSLSEVLS